MNGHRNHNASQKGYLDLLDLYPCSATNTLGIKTQTTINSESKHGKIDCAKKTALMFN